MNQILILFQNMYFIRALNYNCFTYYFYDSKWYPNLFIFVLNQFLHLLKIFLDLFVRLLIGFNNRKLYFLQDYCHICVYAYCCCSNCFICLCFMIVPDLSNIFSRTLIPSQLSLFVHCQSHLQVDHCHNYYQYCINFTFVITISFVNQIFNLFLTLLDIFLQILRNNIAMLSLDILKLINSCQLLLLLNFKSFLLFKNYYNYYQVHYQVLTYSTKSYFLNQFSNSTFSLVYIFLLFVQVSRESNYCQILYSPVYFHNQIYTLGNYTNLFLVLFVLTFVLYFQFRNLLITFTKIFKASVIQVVFGLVSSFLLIYSNLYKQVLMFLGRKSHIILVCSYNYKDRYKECNYILLLSKF